MVYRQSRASQQSFQFIVMVFMGFLVWIHSMEMGKGLIVAMVILAHLQLQLVWLDSRWEIPLFFWHLTKVTHLL